jgi:hypothetical protein
VQVRALDRELVVAELFQRRLVVRLPLPAVAFEIRDGLAGLSLIERIHLSDFDGIAVHACDAQECSAKKREPDQKAELYRGLQDLQSGRKFSKRE